MTVTALSPADAGVAVGDFFVRSWGYDQTNVTFYRVVGLTPKGVRVQEWSSATVDDNGPTTHVVPGDGPRVMPEWPAVGQDELNACRTCRQHADDTWGPGVSASAVRWCDEHGPRPTEAPVQVKRLSAFTSERVPSASGVYIAVGAYNDHASRWDGKPAYETGAGWGH